MEEKANPFLTSFDDEHDASGSRGLSDPGNVPVQRKPLHFILHHRCESGEEKEVEKQGE